MENQKIINCPYCGAEYLPGEIFLPKYLVGEPKDVERDYTGKLIYNEGIEPNNTEEFICEKCGAKFKIIADITYKSEAIGEDMDSEYVSEKYKDRIILRED